MDIKAIRDSLASRFGKPPWEVAAALFAFGVGPEAPSIASEQAGRIDVLVRTPTSLIHVRASSSVPQWWHDVGVVPDDFAIEAAAYPLTTVQQIELVDLQHSWASSGRGTTLTGRWSVRLSGRADEITFPLPREHDDAPDPTSFIHGLMQVKPG